MTSQLVRSALGAWIAQGAPRLAGPLVLLVAVWATPVGGTPSRLRVILGGPPVNRIAGQLQIGPPWTWLLLGLLFVVAVVPLVQLDAAAISLALVRGVSRRRWAVARLAAVALAAWGFLAFVVAATTLTVVVGLRPGPLGNARGAEEVGLWALTLMGVGWWELAVTLVTRVAWPGFTASVGLFGLSAFGSTLPPYLPVAQTIIALHGLPGTLGWAAGTWYLAGWTLFGGLVVWACAPIVLGYW